ncbi:MAG: WG repeat-containing protein [Bacillota bacterium]|nr:WG repeat-containing protein [Bacillota bacterium]
MKKKLCMAMAAMLLLGSMPVYGTETYEEATLFTATVGTKDFLKNGVFQPLDVEIYIKDGYVMLPLRTFMTAADENATMIWHPFQVAQAEVNGHNAVFALEDNIIHVDGKRIDVSGEMEVKEGRLFVPLRNWGQILKLCGYDTADIFWDRATRTATVVVSQTKAIKGEEAAFSMALTDKYDDIENIGDGFFIAQKYMEENFGLGESLISQENAFFLLDAKGKELLKFESGSIRRLRDWGEGTLLVSELEGNKETVIDYSGNILVSGYNMVAPFSEGIARVKTVVDGESKFGYVDRSGNLIVPMLYESAGNFSEGLAAVSLEYDYTEKSDGYDLHAAYGYIDRTSKMVIEAKYKDAGDFFEGVARVRTENGVGYIDKEGKEVIPCQYKWGGYFKNGVTFVTEEDGWKTWLIDKTGKKLQLVAEGRYAVYANDSLDRDDTLKNGVLMQEEIVDLPDGDHKHMFQYFDETGALSYEEYRIKKEFSEGLSPYHHSNLRKYGYVDETGEWIIRPAFDQAEPFEGGYAVVANEIYMEDGARDAEWGIIRHPEM